MLINITGSTRRTAEKEAPFSAFWGKYAIFFIGCCDTSAFHKLYIQPPAIFIKHVPFKGNPINKTRHLRPELIII